MRRRSISNRLASTLLGVLAAGLLGFEGTAHAQSVSVDYGAERIWAGEPNRVTFSVANATEYGEPVLPEVDGVTMRYLGATNTATSITIINGVRRESSSVDLVIEITPDGPGTFRIPSIAIDVDGRIHESKPFAFTAIEPENDGRLIVDIERAGGPVYLGEPVDLVLRIWVRPFRSDEHEVTINDSTTWRLIKHGDSDWGPFEETLQELARSGRRPAGRLVNRAEGEYYLFELTRQLRPTGIGSIDDLSDVEIAMSYPLGLTESRSRSIFRRSELEFTGLMPITARAEVRDIDVMPLPEEGRPEDFRGAVGDFIVRAGARPTNVAVGDPITLTLLVGSVDGDETVLETLRPPPLADLPDLTSRFRIPKDPIAGEVEDTIKVFSQTLRPRSDEVTEIPPIPFSFFDPDSGSYRTVWTQAIPIRVSPAETLAASDIVRAGDAPAAAGGSIPTDDADQPLETGLRANFAVSEDLLAVDRRTLGTTTYGLLAVPPVGFAALALLVARRRWRESHPDVLRARGARGRALARLRNERSPAAIAETLRSYVCDCSGRPATSLTASETLALVRSTGADASVLAGLDELLKAGERAGYGGEEATGPDRCEEAAAFVRSLDRCDWSRTKETAR